MDHDPHLTSDSPVSAQDPASLTSPSRFGREHYERVPNVVFAAGSLLLLLVIAVAAYFVHAWQVRSLGQALLRRADSLETTAGNSGDLNDLRKAANYVDRFARLRPDSEEGRNAQVRLALMHAKFAQNRQERSDAIRLSYRAIGVAKDEEQLAQVAPKLYTLLLAEGLFEEAEREAFRRLQASPSDPQARRAYALALFGQLEDGVLRGRHDGQVSEAGVLTVGGELAAAWAANYGDMELAESLARVYRDLPALLSQTQRDATEAGGDPAEQRARAADALIDQAVAKNLGDPLAHLLRFKYRSRFGLPGRDEDIRKALDLGRDHPEALLAAAGFSRERAAAALAQAAEAEKAGDPPKAESLRSEGKALISEAEGYYRRMIGEIGKKASRTNLETAYLGLGELLRDAGRADEAVATWESGLEALEGESWPLLLSLGSHQLAAGKLAEAEAALGRFDAWLTRIKPLLSSVQRWRLERWRLERASDVLRARCLLKKTLTTGSTTHALQAINLLFRQAFGPGTGNLTDEQRLETWQWLGTARSMLQQWDAAAAAFERVAAIRADQAEPRMAAAECWLAAGRPEMALQWYRQAIRLQDDPDTRFALAVTLLQCERAKARAQRDWGPLDAELQQLDAAAKSGTLSREWRLALLKSDKLLAIANGQQEVDAAIQECLALLREAEQKEPDDAERCRLFALTYQRLGDPGSAGREAARYEKLAGNEAAVLLLRSQLMTAQAQYGEARENLKELMELLPEDQQVVVDRELMRLDNMEGRLEKSAEDRLKTLANARSPDYQAVFQLAILALNNAERWKGRNPAKADSYFAEAESWEQKLRELESSEGELWRYLRGRRSLALVSGSADPRKLIQDPRYQQADADQQWIQQRRPTWSAVYVLQGLIAEERKDTAAATAAYEQAVNYGDRSTFVFERLLLLLPADAPQYQRVVGLIDGAGIYSPRISRFLIERDARQQNWGDAIVRAQRDVRLRPDDPAAHYLLGALLCGNVQSPQDRRAEELLEGERELKRAVELAGDNQQYWMALFMLYFRTGRSDEALRMVEQLAERTDLGPERQAEWMLQCYQILGDRTKAEACLDKALALAPNSSEILLRAAYFYLQTDAEKAEDFARRAVAADPNSKPAGLLMATIYGLRGGKESWDKAMETFRKLETGDQLAQASDRRLEAILRMTRGGSDNLASARRLLEDLVNESNSDQDRALLARLYERLGIVPLAKEQLQGLAARSDNSGTFLREYVEFLIRNRIWTEAETWLTRLESNAAMEGVAVSLWARLQADTGKKHEIAPRVDAFAEKQLEALTAADARAAFAASIGRLYQTLGLFPEAERWYRQAWEGNSRFFAPLAGVLASLDRQDEAIQLCLDAAATDDSPQPEVALCEVILARQSATDLASVEPVLNKAIEEHPTSYQLLLSVANVRFFSGKTDDAIALVKQALDADPDNVVVLNNLAGLLGEVPGRAGEAIGYIDHALSLVGYQPQLLDTKGTILLHEGRVDEALPLLEEAARSPSSDPRFFLHLAAAYRGKQSRADAISQLERALAAGLENQVLTPRENEMLKALEEYR